MHLILTSYLDVTTDMLIDRIGNKAIRVNNDRPQDHEIQVCQEGFRIIDKHGRAVNEKSLRTAIIRKPAPMTNDTRDEAIHSFRETSTAHASLLQLIEHAWPEKLPISPSRIREVTKFVQLFAAKGIFTVAPWAFTTHPIRSGLPEDVVIKTLGGMPFSPGIGSESATFIYVQPVRISELAEGYPWFLQEPIPARFDVTVLYIDGKMFAQRLDRQSFTGLDWRKHIGTEMDNGWENVVLPDGLSRRIEAYMGKLDLRFGRLDFLAPGDNLEDALFLEVNPNGQWAWMDIKMNNGIFDAMIEFLCRPAK